MAKLGEVCLINPKSCTLRDDTEVSFIPMTKVGEHGEFDASEIKNYSEVKKGFTNFQNGDILFAKITPCMENGKGAIAHNMKNGIGFGSTEFHVLRPDTDKITSEWLYYLTTWKTFRKEAERNMTGSAGQKRVPKTFLENYVVNLPDIDTQKSENKILRKVDDLFFLRKQQLAKLDELVKVRFVEMFGEISDNSMNWDCFTIGKLISTIESGWSGNGKQREKHADEIAVLKVSAVTKGYFIPTECKVLDDQHNIKKYVYPQKGDILFSRANTKEMVGATVLIKKDYPDLILPDKLWKIRFCTDVNPIYMKHVLSTTTVRNAFSAASTGTSGSMYNVSMEKFKGVIIPVPPLSVQNEFAAFVERVDQQKQTVQQSLEKLELMKKALMQEYFR